MNDSCFVRDSESARSLRPDLRNFLDRRPVLAELPESSTGYELHRDEVGIIRFTDCVDGDDVRVIER